MTKEQQLELRKFISKKNKEIFTDESQTHRYDGTHYVDINTRTSMYKDSHSFRFREKLEKILTGYGWEEQETANGHIRLAVKCDYVTIYVDRTIECCLYNTVTGLICIYNPLCWPPECTAELGEAVRQKINDLQSGTSKAETHLQQKLF